MSRSHWENERLWEKHLRESTHRLQTVCRSDQAAEHMNKKTKTKAKAKKTSSAPLQHKKKVAKKPEKKKPGVAKVKKKARNPSDGFKVTPRESQGHGPPNPDYDYTDKEWRIIVKELIAIEKRVRKPGDRNVTKERALLCEHYDRNYLTIRRRGEAMGIMAPSVKKVAKKKSRNRLRVPIPPGL